MKLTRRDAVAALAAAGIGAGGVALYAAGQWRDDASTPDPDAARDADEQVDLLRALTEVLYPAEVEVTDEFLETYVVGRRVDDEYHEGMSAGLAALDDLAIHEHDEPLAELSSERLEELLFSLNLQEAEADPGGSDVERIRYYVVNDLLYALYTTPTGGELVGTENPPGYPGGLDSYTDGGDT